MSGVRIVNPQLHELGMTLPGFVERGKVIASLPSLGLLTLAGLTPDSWELCYLDVDAVTDSTSDEIASKQNGLIAISSSSARIEDAYALADKLRAKGRKVIIGGLHASVEPSEAEQHCDAVVVGEGDSVWLDVLQDYELGNLKRRYLPLRTHSFTTKTIPKYSLLDPNRYNRITLQTTRGCPLDCSFCGASRLISHYKKKPISDVEREIAEIKSIWPRPFIELADDNTFVDKRWAKELVACLSKHDVKWFTETDVSVADDEEFLSMLSESGCAQLLIGFESIDVKSLEETDSKHWKARRRDKYLNAIQVIQSHGISVNGCFAFGFDHDQASTFEATHEFIRNSGLSEVQITILTPFAGTRLRQTLKEQGRLLPHKSWRHCTLFDVMFEPANMSTTELEHEFHFLASKVYSESETAIRKQNFRNCIRKKLTYN